ncbi:uncharacterized protein LOC132734725 [Ruditapes philippinarum]|uniref:uncharacterized protein LOC132734725 n=1 Tax=Ruditapes philippinarum TaxID=129788 RepID=UPI00295BA2B8|nr:uncharacterized protein LOC132734725 [Ruditapes philippinarum]
MTWEEKCNILRSNPVTAARHFQFRLDMRMKDMILSDSKPLGHVRHFFYRIEFQQRGSPHAHGILWIDNAPDLEKNSPEEIAAFIDKYVQCRLPDEDSDEELYSLVNQLQRHSHSASCRKSGKECRFGFPRSISSHTLVSRPPSLDDTLPHLIPDQREWNCRIAGVVNQYLERADSLDEMSYEDVLQDCKLLPQVYQQALSKSASSPKVYLKRDPNAVNINNYNAYILRAWQANMDVQFVTDPYACIQYVVSYITKDEREMGTLLHAVAKESAQDTIKDQMKKCGQAFLNSRSVTAQEAAYRALGLPLHKSNFTSVWVPTGLPSERISLLKPTFVLQNLEEGDNDVFVSGISDKYSKRPANLENWCLAQFAAWYEVARKDYEPSDFQPDILADRFNDAEASPSSSVENAPKSIHVPLSSSHCVMRKRRKQAVVRFHKFSEEKQPRSYYHSQLFLFVPWRSERTDLLNGYEDYQDSYIEQKDIIDKNRSYLFKHESLVEAAFEQLQNEDQPREAWDQIAAENQQQEYDAEDEGAQSDQEHAILNPSDQPNIHVELPTPSDSCVQALAIDSMPPPLPYPDYCAHVRTLNSQQYEVLQVVLNWCITFIQSVGNKNVKKPDPLHLFVSGGAGTGKSHLISALYHTIELNLRKEGDTPDCPKVLLLAPTGTAAFNIQGATIHSALLFALKSQASNKQSTSSRPLSDDKKNTLRVKLSQLKFIIIDEISMVGSDFFVDIHNRLSEVFGGTDVFGGISIVAVGDMYQLPPVCQRYIFQPALNMFAALTLSLWGTNFTYMELTQIMRQADDQPFSEMLNRVRTGSHTPDDITLLKSRLITDDTCSNEVHLDKYLHVFATNAKVDAYNVQMLNQLSSEKIHLNATDRIPLSLKNYRLSDDEKHTGGLAKVITIAVGARVILTRNVDVSDGLTNGTQGIVREIKFLSINKPIAIMILFDSPSVGKNARLNSKVDLSAYKEPVVPISQTEATFSPTRSKATVIRKQFPVRLCWATSIHKVQGATLDNIVVSFENRFNSGQAYVALSRVKKLNQLHLISFDEKKIVTSSHVKKEMERMKKDTFHPNPFKSLSANANLTVALLNARSARNHFTDIMCHPVLKIADIVCLTEANVYHDQIRYYQREGWTLKCLEKSSVCNCHGILFYCSENIPVVSSTTSYQPHMEQLFVELSSKPGVGSIQVLYRSPSTAPATFITDLTSTVYDRQPDIILGDFNINVDSVWYRRLSEPLLNYRQCVTLPTHLSGSIIDLVYVKDELPQPKVTVYPTYFSDHSIVFLQF